MPRRRRQLVPECKPALDRMKYEIAAELGLSIAPNAAGFDAEFGGELGGISSGGSRQQYMGYLTARDTGAMGGQIVKRLLSQSEQEAAQTVR